MYHSNKNVYSHISHVFIVLKCVESFFPFFCAEDVFVSTYLVSISSSAIYFMIGERRKRRKNTMGKTSVTENLVLDCTAFWLMQAGRATKKPRFCESNPCCELQRIKNFTHREKNGQILRKTSTPHFFTCWIVVAGKTWATNSNQLPILLHYYRCTHELHCASRATDHCIGLDLILN